VDRDRRSHPRSPISASAVPRLIAVWSCQPTPPFWLAAPDARIADLFCRLILLINISSITVMPYAIRRFSD